MSKRYTVTSIQTPRGPEYVIYDEVNDAYVGFFDTEKWAESVAEMMEEKYREADNGKTSGKHKRMA